MLNILADKFAEKDVQIAVLGCYIHMIHPDKEKRKLELDRFKEHIRFARDFGCSIVGTETGNVHEKTGYTVDNFEEQPFLDVVDSVRELVEEAEKVWCYCCNRRRHQSPCSHTSKIEKAIGSY